MIIGHFSSSRDLDRPQQQARRPHKMSHFTGATTSRRALSTLYITNCHQRALSYDFELAAP
jgi:hypothetical protein